LAVLCYQDIKFYNKLNYISKLLERHVLNAIFNSSFISRSYI